MGKSLDAAVTSKGFKNTNTTSANSKRIQAAAKAAVRKVKKPKKKFSPKLYGRQINKVFKP